jgi:hypothetical protein
MKVELAVAVPGSLDAHASTLPVPWYRINRSPTSPTPTPRLRAERRSHLRHDQSGAWIEIDVLRGGFHRTASGNGVLWTLWALQLVTNPPRPTGFVANHLEIEAFCDKPSSRAAICHV